MGCGASSSSRYVEQNDAAPVHKQQSQVSPLNREQVSHRSLGETSPNVKSNTSVMDVINAKEGSRTSLRQQPTQVTASSRQSLQRDRAHSDELSSHSGSNSRSGSKDRCAGPLSRDDVQKAREDAPYRRPTQEHLLISSAAPLDRRDVAPPKKDGIYRRSPTATELSASSTDRLGVAEVTQTIPTGASGGQLYESTAQQRSLSKEENTAGFDPIRQDLVNPTRKQEGAEALELCKKAAQVDKAAPGSVQKNWAKARSATMMLRHQNDIIQDGAKKRGRGSLSKFPEDAEEDARRAHRSSLPTTENGEVWNVGRPQVEFVEGLSDPLSQQPFTESRVRSAWKTKK